MLAGRETEHHRSVLVAPWVGGSVPADGQTGAVGEIVDGGQQRCRVEFLGRGAGGAEGVGGGAPCRGDATGRPAWSASGWQAITSRRGPVATPPRRGRRTVRRGHGTRGPSARVANSAHQARLADFRLTRDQHHDRPLLGRDVQRPLGEPSRARGQPTSDPSPAPCSHSRAPDPGCHDTQASVRPGGRAHGPRGRPNRGGCRSCAMLRIGSTRVGRRFTAVSRMIALDAASSARPAALTARRPVQGAPHQGHRRHALRCRHAKRDSRSGGDERVAVEANRQ